MVPRKALQILTTPPTLARRALAALLVLLLVPAVALTGLRLVGVSTGYPLAALLTGFPYVVPLGVFVLLVAWIGRLKPLVVASALTVLTSLALLAPRALPGPNADADGAGSRLTVAVANLRFGRGDAAAVARTVEELDVDVLVSLEVTEEALAAYERDGVTGLLPEVVAAPSRLTSGGSIHARVPLESLPASDAMRRGTTPRARLTVNGATVDLDGVHPLPPVGERWTSSWLASLASLPEPADGDLRILAGDFNATHDHAPFRRLLDAGYVDAADAVGKGLVWTFHGLPFGDPVPPVTLDHVLVDPRIRVVAVEIRDLPGSDHRMVVAELVLPSRG